MWGLGKRFSIAITPKCRIFVARNADFVGMERCVLHRKIKSPGIVTGNKPGARVAYVSTEDGAVEAP